MTQPGPRLDYKLGVLLAAEVELQRQFQARLVSLICLSAYAILRFGLVMPRGSAHLL